jgi:cell filamentation protein
MSKYQLKDSHIYIDGTDIPKNKLGVTDADVLHDIENSLLADAYEYFSSQLTANTILDEAYFITLHKNTFESLYTFAGEYRTVNMSKGTSQFCLAQYLHKESSRIFKELEKDSYLEKYQAEKDLFVSKLAYYKCELYNATKKQDRLNERLSS